MEGIPGTTAELNRYVVRDTVGALIGFLVFVALVLLLLPWARGFAVVLFWLGAVIAGLRILQVSTILLTGSILFFARLAGWPPDGPDPRMFLASLVRVIELLAFLCVMYYLHAHIYP